MKLKAFTWMLLFFCNLAFCAQRVARLTRHTATCERLVAQLASQTPHRTQQLEYASNLFENTPGFAILLWHLYKSDQYPSAKGYWFELEKALAVHAQHSTGLHPKVITSFGTIVQAPNIPLQREFDLIALIHNTRLFYECKNMRWTSDPHALRQQFLDQQRVVAALTDTDWTQHMEYRVATKQPIPPRWLRFFLQHKIIVEKP